MRCCPGIAKFEESLSMESRSVGQTKLGPFLAFACVYPRYPRLPAYSNTICCHGRLSTFDQPRRYAGKRGSTRVNAGQRRSMQVNAGIGPRALRYWRLWRDAPCVSGNKTGAHRPSHSRWKVPQEARRVAIANVQITVTHSSLSSIITPMYVKYSPLAQKCVQ